MPQPFPDGLGKIVAAGMIRIVSHLLAFERHCVGGTEVAVRNRFVSR